jgi:hypothetical protein
MRRLLLVLGLLWGIPALSQTTSVSGTITDAGGQSWNYGTVQFTFRPSDSNPTAQYFQNGVVFNKNTTINGTLDNTGSFSGIAVPDNTTITPSGSTFTVQVCPGATTSCFRKNLTISGVSQNITASIVPSAIVLDLGNPPPGAAAYTDSEVTGAKPGSFYYNINGNLLHMCVITPFPPCTWLAIGSSASILPLNNAFTGNNTFAGTTGLNGGGNMSGTWTGSPTLTGLWTFNPGAGNPGIRIGSTGMQWSQPVGGFSMDGRPNNNATRGEIRLSCNQTGGNDISCGELTLLNKDLRARVSWQGTNHFLRPTTILAIQTGIRRAKLSVQMLWFLGA